MGHVKHLCCQLITVITDLTSHSHCVLKGAWQWRRLWWQSCSLSCWAGWSEGLGRRGWRGRNAVEISRGWKPVDIGAQAHSVSNIPEGKTSHIHCEQWQALHQTTAALPEYIQTDANIPSSLLKASSLTTTRDSCKADNYSTLKKVNCGANKAGPQWR